MGGSTGGLDPAARAAREKALDEAHGPGWREAALKTLAQELRDRGIAPRSGDEGYQVVPTPRLLRDRVSLAMILLCLTAIAGFFYLSRS